jgi:hypothetical protein
MQEQDDVITAPVVTRDGARSTRQSLLLDPGASGEVVVVPEPPMAGVVLFVDVEPADASVSVTRLEHDANLLGSCVPTHQLRRGMTIGNQVDREHPLVVECENNDVRQARVVVSLVGGEEKEGQ